MAEFNIRAPPGYTGQARQRPRGGGEQQASSTKGFDSDFDPFEAKSSHASSSSSHASSSAGILREAGSKHNKNVHVNFPASVSTVIPSGDGSVSEDVDYVLYQALYDYNSGDPDDLVFQANDILQVTDEGDGPQSWMEGRSQDGRSGTFPGNYVRKIVLQPRKAINLDMENGGVAKKEDLPPDGSEDEAQPEEDQPIRVRPPTSGGARVTTFPSTPAAVAPPLSKPPKDIGKFVYYQTLYAYNSGEEGDLVFDANEILRVTDEGEDGSGWYYGYTQDDREGSFPSNYVRKIRYQPGSAVQIKLEGLEHT